MKLILLEEDPATGEILQSINLGTFTEKEYFADMADLMTAKDDWDTLCNWLLRAVVEEGILTPDGLNNPGYTLRSFVRVAKTYIKSVQDSKDPDVLTGLVYEFLDGTYGMLINGMLNMADRVGKKGKDIAVSEETFKQVTGMVSAILLRQMWRDPERQRVLQPVAAYFTNPGDVLDA